MLPTRFQLAQSGLILPHTVPRLGFYANGCTDRPLALVEMVPNQAKIN
jgi:hypothetical protein